MTYPQSLSEITLYNCGAQLKFSLPRGVAFQHNTQLTIQRGAFCPSELLHATIAYDPIEKLVCVSNFAPLTQTFKFCYSISLPNCKALTVTQTVLVISTDCVFSGALGNQGATGGQGRLGKQGFNGKQGLDGVQGLGGRNGKQGACGKQGGLGRQGYQGVYLGCFYPILTILASVGQTGFMGAIPPRFWVSLSLITSSDNPVNGKLDAKALPRGCILWSRRPFPNYMISPFSL